MDGEGVAVVLLGAVEVALLTVDEAEVAEGGGLASSVRPCPAGVQRLTVVAFRLF